MKLVKMTKPMTIGALRNEAEKAGFSPVTYTRGEELFLKVIECVRCKLDSNSVEKGTMLAFRANDKKAKIYTAHACTCGYRVFHVKEDYSKKKDSAKQDGKPAMKFRNKCVSKTCSNDLPEDRKSYCYTCRPKHRTTNQESAQEVVY